LREGVGRLTLVLGLVMAIGPLAVDMYLPAMPTLEVEFGASTARVQHTLSAYLLGLAVGQLWFGPIADRYGRKPPLIGGLVLFTLASIACTAAQTIDHFVLARFAQALGGASGMVLIRAMIRDRFDEIQSARVLSLMMLVMGAAPILAPLAGGALLIYGSWHWIFGFLTAFALACALLVAFLLEETHPVQRRSATLLGALRAAAPLFTDRRFVGPVIVFIAPFGAFFAYLAASPFVYIGHFGIPAQHFGWFFGAGAAGFITVSQVNRRMVARHGVRRVLGWGVYGLSAGATVLIVLAATGTFGFFGVLLPIYVMIGSVGFIASNATSVAMAPFGERAGAASSLLGATQSAFGVLASAAVGWIGGRGPVPMAAVMFACSAVAFLAYVSMVREKA
jgi:MFS transporter, DHA1 family, multidrug resistance protein